MDTAHTICTLEKEVAVLTQKIADADKALSLAREVISTRWIALGAVLASVTSLLLELFKH